MISKRFLLKTAVAAIALLTSCSSTKDYNFAITEKKHTVAALKQDVDLAHQILKDGHPGLYWYISKKQLDYKFDSLKNSFNEPMTSNQFYQKLSPVIAAIKCGHTALRYPSKIYKDKKEREVVNNRISALSQFTYAVTANDKLIVINNKSKNKNIKTGTEILEIDGNPVANIFNHIDKGFSYDGYNEHPRNKRIELSFSGLYRIYYGDSDSLLLKYKLKDSVGESYISFSTKKKDNKVDAKKVDTVKTTTVAKKMIPTKKELKYRGKKVNGEYQLDFKFLDSTKDVAYLKINSFSVPTANFPQFYKQCFDSIHLAEAKNLVIDIRNNPGGTLNASLALFSYLTDKEFVYLAKPVNNGGFNAAKYSTGVKKAIYYLTAFNDNSRIYEDEQGNSFSFMKGYTPQKPHKNNFKGKVYVLINEFSFSASSLLSANLKGINRATFVGKETGGGANQCTAGGIPVVQLKNTKISLRFGLNRMAPIYQQDVYGRGVFPDVEIASTLEDRIKNYDRELQWVVADIKTKDNVRK